LLENLLIHASDCITQDVELPDPLFERIAEHFNDQEKLEIITTISAYNMVSRFLKALKISY
jgi:alkylhydroperoxidase family enzyme